MSDRGLVSRWVMPFSRQIRPWRKEERAGPAPPRRTRGAQTPAVADRLRAERPGSVSVQQPYRAYRPGGGMSDSA